MADKDITIGIKTTGADASAKAIRKVDDATGGLAKTTGKDAVRAMQDSADKARVSEFAFYDLDAEVKKTVVSTGAFTAGQTKLQTGTRNSSQALLMFSQGFEDAQYGIRGVLNNIPGLIIALGGTAGLAGGISIAAVALSQLGPLFTKTGESAEELKKKAEKTAEQIKEVAANMGEMEGERFDAVIQEFEDLRAAGEAIKDQVDLTKAADNAFALSALDNAGKIDGAIRNLIASRGIQIDKTKELQALAAADQAKRELVTQQAIGVEQNKLEKAQEAQTTAADTLGTEEASLNVEKGRLVAAEGRLAALRKERDELQKIAQERDLFNVQGPDGVSRVRAQATPAAKAAQTRLDSQDFKTELEGAESRIETLNGRIEKQGRVILGMENALNKAIQSREDIEGAVNTKIEELNATLAADTTVAKVDQLRQTQEATAAKLTEVYSQIETSNAAGEAAKQTILQAAADGKVTADEQLAIADDVRAVIAQVQSGQASYRGTVQELFALQKTMAEQAVRDGALARAHTLQIQEIYKRLR